MYSDIIIIGAGAAGLMAGYAAASNGAQVTILEKMPRPGRKIMITGKGRCNFTNLKEWNDFSAHIRSKVNFIRPSFYNLPPKKVIELLEEEGLPTVVERGDRAYPQSMKSMDVVDTLVNAVRRKGAEIVTNCEIKEIVRLSDEAADNASRFQVKTSSGACMECHSLIVATGGLSYPGTGSTGDGYGFAEQLGHKVVSCFPSLTALVPKGYKTIDKDKAALAPTLHGHIHRSTELSENGQALCGVHLKNIGLSLYANDSLVQTEFGDLDFTDGGIEGPLGFTLSRNGVKAILNGNKVKLVLDMKSGIDENDVHVRLKGLWNEISKDPRSKKLHIKEMYRILLSKLMPWELIPGFQKLNPDILTGRKGNERINLETLAHRLKEWTFEIEGYVGYERCVITAGGVSTDEIFPKTMESRLVPGLYFSGELVDMDADTGGYNMQIAFCTGYLAGLSAAKAGE